MTHRSNALPPLKIGPVWLLAAVADLRKLTHDQAAIKLSMVLRNRLEHQFIFTDPIDCPTVWRRFMAVALQGGLPRLLLVAGGRVIASQPMTDMSAAVALVEKHYPSEEGEQHI